MLAAHEEVHPGYDSCTGTIRLGWLVLSGRAECGGLEGLERRMIKYFRVHFAFVAFSLFPFLLFIYYVLCIMYDDY